MYLSIARVPTSKMADFLPWLQFSEILFCLFGFFFSNRALTQVQKTLSIFSADLKCLSHLGRKVIFIQLSHSHAIYSYYLCHSVRKNCTKLHYYLTFEELTDSVYDCYERTSQDFISVATGKISSFHLKQVRTTELADGSVVAMINTKIFCTYICIFRFYFSIG